MSELREADEAVRLRCEAVEVSDPDGDPWPFLFMGMDLNSDEVWQMAGEHTGAAMHMIGETARSDGEGNGAIEPRDLAAVIQSSWLDGFSVAAMLFLRRREGNTR